MEIIGKKMNQGAGLGVEAPCVYRFLKFALSISVLIDKKNFHNLCGFFRTTLTPAVPCLYGH